jgi:hypothetical protein
LSPSSAKHSVSLALLIIRAGEKDSLKWWDDESLSEAGLFALSRVLPRNPRAAAVRLAYLAARERHRGVLVSAGVQGATTLLDFVEPALATSQEGASLVTVVRDEPITSVDRLRTRLHELASEVTAIEIPASSGEGLLDLSDFVGRAAPGPEGRAALLAAGYLQGQVGKPVIPYFRAGTRGGL